MGPMATHEPKLLLGPLVVVAVLASAQCGAYALDAWPRSALLWYLNLEVFRPVQYSFFMGQGMEAPGTIQAFSMVLGLLALICSGLFGKARLPLAIASNLSFLYSVVLLYGLYAARNPALEVSVKLSALWGPAFVLVLLVVLATFVSSASAHRAYWREIIP
jgi:hypothetical protein